MADFTREDAKNIAIACKQTDGQFYLISKISVDNDRVVSNVVVNQDVTRKPELTGTDIIVYGPNMYHTILEQNNGSISRTNLTNYLYTTINKYIDDQKHKIELQIKKEATRNIDQKINHYVKDFTEKYLTDSKYSILCVDKQTKRLHLLTKEQKGSQGQYRCIINIEQLVENNDNLKKMKGKTKYSQEFYKELIAHLTIRLETYFDSLIDSL